MGADTDGTTYPQDIGFGRIIEKKESDFVGRRSTMRPDGLRTGRRQLVGLERLKGSDPLPVGAHIVDDGEPLRSQGYVTSSGFSPTLKKPVALALVENGRERTNSVVRIKDIGQDFHARIIKPGVYDPEGERLRD